MEAQAEYVRDGMDFKLFEINLKHYIEETSIMTYYYECFSIY